MSWRMITDAEIRHLSGPKKMFAYADSYLRSATALCEELTTAFAPSWADGAVVLMMSAHATELFLKGMLLKRLPEQQVWKRGHDLEGLGTDYRTHFPQPQFAWEVPFRAEYPPGSAEEEIAALAPSGMLRQAFCIVIPWTKLAKTGKVCMHSSQTRLSRCSAS